MRYKAATALATVLLAASSAGVYARPAIATFNANLRSGPGVENPVVAIIPDQATIDVGGCTGSWCRVSWNGFDGYLSRTLIASVSSRTRIAEEQPVAGPPVVSVDRPLAASPACDPAFDANCAGYAAGYAYGGGYDPYYAYSNYDADYYDNYDIYGGVYLGGDYGPRYGGGRFGGGARYMQSGRPAYGGAPVVNANAPGNRTVGRIGGAHLGAGRIGAGPAVERR